MNCKKCKQNIVDKKHKNRTYCSHKCQQEYQTEEYIIRWKNGEESGSRGKFNISEHIRNYLFKKYDSKCTKCGWNEVNPSQIMFH